jgi:hypothetical protein
MTVYVPVEAQTPDRDGGRDNYREPSLPSGRDASLDMAAELSRIADGFRDAVKRISEAKDGETAALREQLDHERARSDRAEAELRASQEAVRRAETALDHYYQADAERRVQGRWARIRAAWRGE